MDAFGAEWFASDWIAAWNSHDLDRILSHYSEGVTVSSPLIATLGGTASATLSGRPAVRGYWTEALKRFPHLHFELIAAYPGADSLVIVYRSVADLVGAEFMRFDGDGKVAAVHAHYRPARA